MTKQDKALVILGKTHEKLVKGLKDSLLLSSFAWIKAGEFLSEIRKKETYKSEDSSRQITFAEFCERPDLPLPGRKDSSRLRTAQLLIHDYDYWVIKKKIGLERLASIGYSKLDLLVPVVQKQGNLDEWLDKASMLTSSDLIKEIRQGDKSLEDILDCPHKNIKKVTFYECEDCHTVWKNNPNDKK